MIEAATERLKALGFEGQDLYLAELIPLVEMAKADGVVEPNERALLEAFAIRQVRELNAQASSPVFDLDRALDLLRSLLERRLLPHERQAAILALKDWWQATGQFPAARQRVLDWARAVATVSGRPALDTRELFWLRNLSRSWETA